jgi:outer membrane murein-binding lipoprotein Lpp
VSPAEQSTSALIDTPPQQATEAVPVTLFTPDQWLIVALIFLLGLVLGAALMAGGKWKRRYREERARCAELEAENKRLEAEHARLRKDSGEMDTLRQAAARDEARRRTDGPGPL